MNFLATDLPEVIIVEPDIYRDARGFFLETYHQRKYSEGGIDVKFVQDNHSRSSYGTLRGLHAQRAHPQGKLIRVIEGEIFDVAVDIRSGSPTFGKWISATLSEENGRQCFIPSGFAHGFCVVSKVAQVEYKCTDFYEAGDEITILWSDPAIGIDWPIKSPILSEKDSRGLPLDRLKEFLPVFGTR
jgi:dTDP-4-dehydrorhamnose 3,5-epimerase